MPVARVEKPWGYEIIWARTDRYAGKLLHVRKGESLSLQFHRAKDETLYVARGVVDLDVEEGGRLVRKRLHPGEAHHIPAGTRHRIAGVEESDVFEASTPELDDVVRLEDRYGRASVDPGR